MKTKIILNGKEIETVETTAFKLKDKLGKPTDSYFKRFSDRGD